MEFISNYALFFLKAATLVAAILIAIAGIIAISHKDKSKKLTIKKLNEKLQETATLLKETLLDKKSFKEFEKQQKKSHKQLEKQPEKRKKMFVLHFHGDMRASHVGDLADEITAILTVAEQNDEIVVKIESPGGLVHSYGLAASQLKRIKDQNLRLTVVVDKIAASGGYMMACVADQLICAPFAIIGSIGVVAQLPNFNKLLKHYAIDYELLTAGDYKRTLTLFGENTEEGRQKSQEQIEDTHTLFKEFIQHFRPSLDLEKVATGEYWFGTRALELNLVDSLMTSDDYLLRASHNHDIFEIETKKKTSLSEKISHAVSFKINQLLEKIVFSKKNL